MDDDVTDEVGVTTAVVFFIILFWRVWGPNSVVEILPLLLLNEMSCRGTWLVLVSGSMIMYTLINGSNGSLGGATNMLRAAVYCSFFLLVESE